MSRKFNEADFIREFQIEVESDYRASGMFRMVNAERCALNICARLGFAQRANQTLVNKAVRKWWHSVPLMKDSFIHILFDHKCFPGSSSSFGTYLQLEEGHPYIYIMFGDYVEADANTKLSI